MKVKKSLGHRIFPLLAALLLLAYGLAAYRFGLFPFERKPEPVPPEKTVLERYAEWLAAQDLDEDVREALLEAGPNPEEPVFTFREKEVTVLCEKEDETSSGNPSGEQIWLKIEGTDPRLVCSNLFDWNEGEPPEGLDRGVRYEIDGKTCYPDTADLYVGQDLKGLCRISVTDAVLLGEVRPILLDKNNDGNYVMEDGYYRFSAVHGKGYGAVGLSPEWIHVVYDETAEEPFRLVCSWSEGEELEKRLSVVIFEKKSASGGGGGGDKPDPGPGGQDPDPGPGGEGDHKCNHSGCDSVPIHCRWCGKWHCFYHICEKRWAYNFWCMNQTQDYDLSAYQRAYEHFVEGSGAANYQKWIPEFEAFGVQYHYDD